MLDFDEAPIMQLEMSFNKMVPEHNTEHLYQHVLPQTSCTHLTPA